MSPRLPAPACSQAPLGASCCCCKLCDMGGCDVRVMTCGCCLHARCCPVAEGKALRQCPICFQPAVSLQLMPMNFEEMDQACRQAALTAMSDKRGKKRKNATIARLLHSNNNCNNPQENDLPASASASVVVVPASGAGAGCTTTITFAAAAAAAGPGSTAGASASTSADDSGDLRTGRWTPEEIEYCDSLIRLFEEGKLPIPEGLKLNEFLASMLKSKQARLTKKMKNAKLATRQYKRAMGYIAVGDEAKAFSRLETEFFASIKCPMERSEIRFHMQKEWRELFSAYCIAIGQTLDANAWLCSIEELDQRMSLQQDAARMVRRKVMLGHALSFDASNSMQRGVYIDTATTATTQQQQQQQQQQQLQLGANGAASAGLTAAVSTTSQTSLISDSSGNDNLGLATIQRRELMHELSKNEHNPMKHYASPFIEKVMKLMTRLSIPFEHVDAWVPSFVSQDQSAGAPAAAPAAGAADGEQQLKCRLCFAGCATADNKIAAEGGLSVPLGADEKFDLLSFGEYSEKFSFDIGCGLPGRVYSSGVASWEQGIQNAPLSQFERSGGASQWGIQTVLGIPIPSPSAGRIVILFYSTLDRPRNLALVNRISEALSKLRPSPKWKLVVDVGVGPPPQSADMSDEEAQLHHELLILIQNCTPADKNSPLATYLPGFTSLRLLLVQQARSPREDDLLKSVLASYASYKKGGHRSDTDIASMTARDFMLLSKQSNNDAPQLQGARMNVLALPSEQQQQQQQPFQHQRDDPDPLLAPIFTGMVIQTAGGPSSNNSAQAGKQELAPLLGQQCSSGDNDNTHQESALQQFSMANHLYGHEFNGLHGVSPALHPIYSSHDQFASLGMSPALHPIASQQDGVLGLTPLGLSASQIAALLQNDDAMHF